MELLISLCIFLGIVFSVISAVGIHRLKDIYSRLYATSVMSTLGLMSLILGSVFYFAGTSASHSLKQVLTIVFIFITVPAGAHMISRAAIVRDVPLWKGSSELSDEERKILAGIKTAAIGSTKEYDAGEPEQPVEENSYHS